MLDKSNKQFEIEDVTLLFVMHTVNEGRVPAFVIVKAADKLVE
jgi:hypothetical protein